ncbi:hypothetical protein GJ496_000576 [Pomphorhynchus laevis]|nr:hypothetical protein GJ496_000576 [Pomphorhynchus laevis]
MLVQIVHTSDYSSEQLNKYNKTCMSVPNTVEDITQQLNILSEKPGTIKISKLSRNVINALKIFDNVKVSTSRVMFESFKDIENMIEVLSRWKCVGVHFDGKLLESIDSQITYAVMRDLKDKSADNVDELQFLCDFVKKYLKGKDSNSLLPATINSILAECTDHVAQSVEVLKHVLSFFGSDHCCVCFNGGKDCTVALDLTMKAVKEILPNNKCPSLVLLTTNDEFPEIIEFVRSVSTQYNLLELRADSYKLALKKLRDQYPRFLACIMGSRRSDPGCSDLSVLAVTDNGWPSFIRINPIIDWSYTDIWEYIRKQQLSYCCLYDRGYTSIGPRSKTKQNSALIRNGEYIQASSLHDDSLERSGRSKSIFK